MTPIEVVKMYNEVCWHQRKPELAADILADKVVRNYVGKREILTREESIERIREGIEKGDMDFTFHDFIDGGNKITIIWEAVSNIMKDDDGNDFICAGIEVFRVEDGKICEVWNADYALGKRWPLNDKAEGA